MVLAVEVGDWAAFYTAVAGAAAALAGLFFVAISINVQEILSHADLPRRAAETVVVLISSLLTSVAALMPDLSDAVLGSVLLVITGVAWLAPQVLWLQAGAPRGASARTSERGPSRGDVVVRLLLVQLATLPGVIGSAMLLFGSTTGLYLVAVGILASFLMALVNAWVLLIEILR